MPELESPSAQDYFLAILGKGNQLPVGRPVGQVTGGAGWVLEKPAAFMSGYTKNNYKKRVRARVSLVAPEKERA